MCVGKIIEDPLQRSQNGAKRRKQSNHEERKEKAKDAARTRRMLESDYFEELEKLLPRTETPPSSQQAGLDKTSIIRLNIAQLKIKDVLKNGIHLSSAKEETVPSFDLFSCLDGFSLVLGSDGDVIYVSENVSRYVGLTQVELLGQQFSEYVHPCDHNQLKVLIPRRTGPADEHVEIFVRVKCTMTERGRMINLNQASYKPIKISGKARCMPENEPGGVTGTVFLGLATTVVKREDMVETQIGVFITKHAVDMKFTDTDAANWMSSIAGYTSTKLSGLSFYDLVHAQDIGDVQKALKNLVEHGQCETSLYRLLCYGGGFVWLQTKACLTTARRGSNKGQSILCSHKQISEVLNRDEILSTVQMKNKTQLAPPLTKVTNSIIHEDARGSVVNTNINETRMNISLMEKKIETATTSVIVKTSHLQSHYISVPVIQNTNATVQNEEFLAYKADAQETSRGPSDLNTTTQSIFNISDTTQGSDNTSDLLKELLTINLNEGHELTSKENDFLDDILDDMERRSPHSGDQCVSIESKDSENEKLRFDDVPMLNFEDKFNVDAREFFKAIEQLPFDQTQLNKNAMLGSGRQSIDPYGALQHNSGVPGHALCNGGGRESCHSNSTAEGYPEHMQSDRRIIMDQRQRLSRNPRENSFEPTMDKITLQTKKELQESYPGGFEDGAFSKRLKLSAERSPSKRLVIKPMGDAKLGNSLDK